MPLSRGALPLCYRRLGRSEIGAVTSLELDPEQVERFLGPIADMLAAIRRGPAHSMIGIEAAGELIGFYVVHPDARDQSCWWLGWFAIDRRSQGCGYGRLAMQAIMDRLRRVDGCRRVKLLVAPENRGAAKLYGQARFRRVGVLGKTGELIMECCLGGSIPSARDAVPLLAAALLAPRLLDRMQAVDAPLWALSWSAVHGPPHRGRRGGTDRRVFRNVVSRRAARRGQAGRKSGTDR